MARIVHVWCDLDRALGVVGPTNSSLASYRFFQNDTVLLVMHGLRANTSSTLAGSPYETASISWVKLVASLTLVDSAPIAGTFKVRVTGAGENPTVEDTPALDYNELKQDFESALNALASVTAAGGVTVLIGGASNIYRIQKNNPAAVLTFSVVENKLSPVCFCDVRTDPDTPGKLELKLYRAPVALSDSFSLPVSPAIDAPTRVRVGSVTRNEVQRVTIPGGAVGQFALDFSGLSGELIAVSGVKTSTISTALNDPYTSVNAGDVRFSVTNPAAGVFDIEFIGAFAKATQPLFTVEMFDQVPTDLPQAEMQVTSLRVEDLLDTAASAGLLFEVAAFDANGEKTTLFQQPATIVNNAIDATAITQSQQQLLTRTETVYQYVDPTQPMLYGLFGRTWTPDQSAQDYTFEHDFNTWKPVVEVYRKTSDDPEVWTRVPSNQYTVDATTANQIRVYNFAFPVATSCLTVEVIDPDAQALLNDHEHTTDQVYRMIDGAKTTLTSILDNLSNILPTGWPNIPVNKLDGKLSLDNLDIEAIAEALSTSTDFPTTLKDLFSDPALANAVADSLATSTDFTSALKTLLATADVSSVISTSLKVDSSFMAVVRDMFTTLLATGGVMPEGMTLIQIADLSAQYPPLVTQGTVSLPPLLPTAVAGLTSKGTLNDIFPAASSSKGFTYTLGKKLAAPPVRGLRARTQYAEGTVVVCDGDTFYEADIVDQTAWPKEMDRRLFAIPLTEAMFAPSTKFALLFTFAVNLVGNCMGQYMFVLKTGVPKGAAGFGANLQEVNWDAPLIEAPILLSSATVFHTFGLTLSRAADGTISGTATRYAKTTALSDPLVGANRVVYAGLERFDTDDLSVAPTGQVTLKMTGAKASIVNL